MKKFIIFVLVFLCVSTNVFASDMKFVQVDGLRFSADDKQSLTKFENIIKEINNIKKVDFVVFSGNNIAKPDEKNLTLFLKKAKKLKAPYYVVLGTKDVNKQKHLSKAEYTKIVNKYNHTQRKYKTPNYAFEKRGIVFVIADGSKEVIPLNSGYYKPEVIEWLDSTLNYYSNKKVIILQHYPLIPPSNKESYYTYKADEYLQMLSKHSNVKAVFAGHFGVNNEQEVNGIKHFATAEAPQFRVVDILDYNTDNPTFWSILK